MLSRCCRMRSRLWCALAFRSRMRFSLGVRFRTRFSLRPRFTGRRLAGRRFGRRLRLRSVRFSFICRVRRTLRSSFPGRTRFIRRSRGRFGVLCLGFFRTIIRRVVIRGGRTRFGWRARSWLFGFGTIFCRGRPALSSRPCRVVFLRRRRRTRRGALCRFRARGFCRYASFLGRHCRSMVGRSRSLGRYYIAPGEFARFRGRGNCRTSIVFPRK